MRNMEQFLRRCVVNALNFVDEKFYFREYPDVAASGMSAAEHFHRFGLAEGRLPNRFRMWWWRRQQYRLLRVKPERRKLYDPEMPDLTRDGLFYLARTASATKLHKMIREILIDVPPDSLVCKVLRRVRVQDAGEMRRLPGPASFGFIEPPVYGEIGRQIHRVVDVPESWIATVRQASVIGGFQVLKNDWLVQYEPAADQRKGFVAGIWPFLHVVGKSRNRVVAWFRYDHVENLEAGILLSGRCSPNYFHWLIEYLPRVQPAMTQLDKVRPPLLVDADMYPQEFESLAVIAGDWPIHKVRKATLLHVDTLHIPSIPTYHPDSIDMPFWKGSAVNVDSLKFLRERAWAAAGVSVDAAPPTRRIYVARRQGRNVTNGEEVEAVLRGLDFEVVDTAGMSFIEQVRLFASAAVLVGAVGAAFSNLVFCDPRCKVICFVSPFGKRYSMQASLAQFAGCEYMLIAGQHPRYSPGAEDTNRDVNLLQESFGISKDELEGAVRHMLGRQ